jgi:DNA replication protein DnaD
MGEYSYTYFQKIVRFKLTNKKKNMQLIQESLQEFVDNRIAIKDFELANGVFIIYFLPLSPAEIEDLNFNNIKAIEEV